MTNLEEVVNKERLLGYALKNFIKDFMTENSSISSIGDTKNINEDVSTQIIYWYIANEMDDEPTEESMFAKFTEYVTMAFLQDMCNKNELRYSFDDNKYYPNEEQQ